MSVVVSVVRPNGDSVSILQRVEARAACEAEHPDDEECPLCAGICDAPIEADQP